MKLIFKIFKKMRDLKREERKLKENIEQCKKEEIKLEKKRQDAWKEFHKETAAFSRKLIAREDRLKCIREECELKKGFIYSEKKELEEKEDALNKRKQELNEREEEINETQRKLNDQILKLGIVNGVNN